MLTMLTTPLHRFANACHIFVLTTRMNTVGCSSATYMNVITFMRLLPSNVDAVECCYDVYCCCCFAIIVERAAHRHTMLNALFSAKCWRLFKIRRYGPHFEDIPTIGNVTNITVPIGNAVYLNCRISLLQDKVVRI